MFHTYKVQRWHTIPLNPCSMNQPPVLCLAVFELFAVVLEQSHKLMVGWLTGEEVEAYDPPVRLLRPLTVCAWGGKLGERIINFS